MNRLIYNYKSTPLRTPTVMIPTYYWQTKSISTEKTEHGLNQEALELLENHWADRQSNNLVPIRGENEKKSKTKET